MKLGDYLKSINYKNEYCDDLSDYVPFIINRCFSYFDDTILISNEMNLNSHIDKKMQYDFYYNIITKGKRYSPWIKSNIDEIDKMICKFYKVNINVARDYRKIMNEDDINKLKKKLDKGGIKK